MKRAVIIVACLLASVVCGAMLPLVPIAWELLDPQQQHFIGAIVFLVAVSLVLLCTVLGLAACMRSSQVSECERRTRGFD